LDLGRTPHRVGVYAYIVSYAGMDDHGFFAPLINPFLQNTRFIG